MLALKFLLSIIVAIIIVFFLVINSHTIAINYYTLHFEFQSVSLPLSVVVTTLTLSGFLIAWIMGTFEQLKLKRTIRKQNKIIKSLNNKLPEPDNG